MHRQHSRLQLILIQNFSCLMFICGRVFVSHLIYYSIKAELYRHNEVLDQVTVRHGFREFHVDPEKGFYLNGILTPLRGVSRHQDFLGLGNALTLAHHEMDARLIKEVGANTIRLAHYQHSQDFYNLCDEMGFIVWAENSFYQPHE